jgi:ABC-type dipeptide/oligopeptide/nickel transport system permease subunit
MRRKGGLNRWVALVLALICFAVLFVPGLFAPEHLAPPVLEMAYAPPADMAPFGADDRGRPLLEYALQGASVVALPALLAGLLVSLLGIVGGLLGCDTSQRAETVVQGLGEVVGALPRMVVILVVALLMPKESRSLLPIALTWAVLSAPGAMDEANAVAARLGGARFVEALRAHGFSRARIYLLHIIGLNLRPVVVRQGVETMMQVVFLEIGLSYLAVQDTQPSLTHGDSEKSWADLLYFGYQTFLGVESGHGLLLGLALVGVVALTTVFVTSAVRAR